MLFVVCCACCLLCMLFVVCRINKQALLHATGVVAVLRVDNTFSSHVDPLKTPHTHGMRSIKLKILFRPPKLPKTHHHEDPEPDEDLEDDLEEIVGSPETTTAGMVLYGLALCCVVVTPKRKRN